MATGISRKNFLITIESTSENQISDTLSDNQKLAKNIHKN